MTLIFNDNLHDSSAEAGVLSAMLHGDEPISIAVSILKPDMMYKPTHKQIFTALQTMYESDISADPVTLIDYMKRNKMLTEPSVEAYIADELTDLTVSDANLKYHAEIVKEKYRLREIAKVSSEMNRHVMDGGKPSRDIIDIVEHRLTNIDIIAQNEGLQPASVFVTPVMQEITNSMQQRTPRGLMTGFVSLDNKMGGLLPGNLMILAARPSMGKTSMAMQSAIDVARSGKSVGIFSLEMSSHELMYRGVSVITGIPVEDIINGRSLNSEKVKAIGEAMEELNDLSIYIDDCSTQTPVSVKSRIRRTMFSGKKLDFVLLDHLTLMSYQDSQAGNRNLDIGNITKETKGMAKEFQIPFCLLCQLNRNLEHREDKRPRLSDLRDSGNIEQDADKVVFIYRDDYYEKENSLCPGIAEIIVAKNRNGGTGKVQMFFQKECTRFLEKGTGI
jgi:replicative DNA helicase